MIGSPGSGKTMLSRRLPTILPPLIPGESLATRPSRAPHHTISLRRAIQLLHQGIVFLAPVRLQELPLVPPGRERRPQHQVGAEDRDEQRPTEEVKEVA